MAAEVDNSSVISLKNIVVLTENDGVPGSKFEKDPESYTVEQLKRWLKCRGLKQSGKRGELLTRVRDCIASGNHNVLDPSIDNCRWYEAKEKQSSTSTGDCIDSKVPITPSSGWKKFPSQDIPIQFNYGHVHYYGLESLPNVSLIDKNKALEDSDEDDDTGLGHMTDKPFKLGRKYLDSGYIHDEEDNIDGDYYYLRAHIWHSMSNDYPHNVVVVLSLKSGAVIHAKCEPCKASKLGRCSHVIALLLYVVDYIEKNGHTVSTPCTSQECSSLVRTGLTFLIWSRSYILPSNSASFLPYYRELREKIALFTSTYPLLPYIAL